MFGRWLGHEGRALRNEMNAFIRGRRELPCSSGCVRTHCLSGSGSSFSTMASPWAAHGSGVGGDDQHLVLVGLEVHAVVQR